MGVGEVVLPRLPQQNWGYGAAAFQNADGRCDSEKGAELTLALFVRSDSDPCHLLKVQVKYYPTFR